MRNRDFQLIKAFWDAPIQEFFTDKTVSRVVGRSSKELQFDRISQQGIDFVYMDGKIFYRKSHVIAWLNERSNSQSKSFSSE